MIGLPVLTIDLRGVIGFSSFSMLVYYAIANASAFTQPPAQRHWPLTLNMLGAAGCLTLVATLPLASVALAAPGTRLDPERIAPGGGLRCSAMRLSGVNETAEHVRTCELNDGHRPVARMDRSAFTYSIVVPVYNSVEVVGRTVDTIVDVFESAGLSYQLVLVNDGSRDGSWDVIADRARHNCNVVALNLLRNYGQHFANLAGMREATGDYVITMDDDLQNPPDQAIVLIDEAMTGRDVVFGKFDHKQAAGYRRIGSKLIGMINRRIFAQPPDLTVSNFRILRRDVVDRICDSRSAYPYITGQALMYSSNRSNVVVRHEPRPVGKSTYGLSRVLRLVLTILFAYSSFPLRVAAGIGALIAVLSFFLGAVYVVHAMVVGSTVPGWTSLIVLLAFFNGVTIALLSMLGEYVVRTLNTVSSQQHYHVVARVGS